MACHRSSWRQWSESVRYLLYLSQAASVKLVQSKQSNRKHALHLYDTDRDAGTDSYTHTALSMSTKSACESLLKCSLASNRLHL
jgi:hypothetical protein